MLLPRDLVNLSWSGEKPWLRIPTGHRIPKNTFIVYDVSFRGYMTRRSLTENMGLDVLPVQDQDVVIARRISNPLDPIIDMMHSRCAARADLCAQSEPELGYTKVLRFSYEYTD
jgi:hypothetical protein